MSPAAARLFRQPTAWAAVAVVLAFSWQALTVQANYAGHWNGLFRTGRDQPVPAALAPSTFRNPHPSGYDGQFYRYLAHDPLLRHEALAHMDEPALRARRILVPALAWLLAFGQAPAIDAAFVAVILLSVFLGALCFSLIAASRGLPPVWGLLFLAVPAVFIGIDTLTVDVALAALTALYALQLLTPHRRGLWLTLAAAPLVRETGFLLPASCALCSLYARQWRQALIQSTAAVPGFAWFAYVHFAVPAHAGPRSLVPAWYVPEFEVGIWKRIFDPPQYGFFNPSLEYAIRSLDVLAMLAFVALAILGVRQLLGSAPCPLRLILASQILLIVALPTRSFWATPYGYNRPFAPLFVLLLAAPVASARHRDWMAILAACALVNLRLLAEAATQALGIIRWLGLAPSP